MLHLFMMMELQFLIKQSSLNVSYGQHVNQGDVIGYVGSTGWSTGYHLHFEIRVNGSRVDPTGYLY